MFWTLHRCQLEERAREHAQAFVEELRALVDGFAFFFRQSGRAVDQEVNDGRDFEAVGSARRRRRARNAELVQHSMHVGRCGVLGLDRKIVSIDRAGRRDRRVQLGEASGRLVVMALEAELGCVGVS